MTDEKKNKGEPFVQETEPFVMEYSQAKWPDPLQPLRDEALEKKLLDTPEERHTVERMLHLATRRFHAEEMAKRIELYHTGHTGGRPSLKNALRFADIDKGIGESQDSILIIEINSGKMTITPVEMEALRRGSYGDSITRCDPDGEAWLDWSKGSSSGDSPRADVADDEDDDAARAARNRERVLKALEESFERVQANLERLSAKANFQAFWPPNGQRRKSEVAWGAPYTAWRINQASSKGGLVSSATLDELAQQWTSGLCVRCKKPHKKHDCCPAKKPRPKLCFSCEVAFAEAQAKTQYHQTHQEKEAARRLAKKKARRAKLKERKRNQNQAHKGD